MKNKAYLFLSQCIFIVISFFNKLFVSDVNAQSFDSTLLAGAIEPAPPTPGEIIVLAIKLGLIVLVPIGLITILVIFLKKKIGKKQVGKKKK